MRERDDSKPVLTSLWRRFWLTLVVSVAVWPGGGCRAFLDEGEKTSQSPLRTASPAAGSVTLEIFWARFPADDLRLSEEVWQQIDEGQIPADVRRDLAANGFRAGVVGSMVPEVLAEALRVDRKSTEPDMDGPAEDARSPATDEPAEPGAHEVQILAEPTVRRRLLQLERGRRAEIQASDSYDELPLLVLRDGEMSGRTYTNAQAIYALEVDLQPDGSTHVVLTPELHHGVPRLRWASEDGLLRQTSLREQEIFSRLQSAVSLAPGEMLIVTCSPHARGRLGHFFHTVGRASGQQKLILVRVAEVPDSKLFASDDSHWPWR